MVDVGERGGEEVREGTKNIGGVGGEVDEAEFRRDFGIGQGMKGLSSRFSALLSPLLKF